MRKKTNSAPDGKSGSKKAPARKKPGRPRNEKIDNRDMLETNIMGILAPGYQPPVPPALAEDKIVELLTTSIFQGSEHKSRSDVMRAHEQAFIESHSDTLQQARKDALRRLVFQTKEVVKPEVFLKLLLPDTRLKRSMELLKETCHQIPLSFLTYFVNPVRGWPKTHLASLKEAPCPYPGAEHLEDHYLDLCTKAVTFDAAMIMAPFILSWAKLTASPEFRGSLRQHKKSPTEQATSVD